MNTGLAWKLAAFLAVTAPVVGLGVPACAAGRDAVQIQSPLDSDGVSHQETTLGDVVADAVRQTGSADIALVAADDITEASFSTGSVAQARIVQTLRYADDPTDTVVVLSLTGAQLRKVLERSVSREPQPFDGFLQVSGLSFRYDPSQPEGKRLTQLQASGGGVVGDSHTYRVATTRPVADGSFGYFRFWSKSDILEDTHTSIASGMTNYLNTHKTIHVTLENRISTP